MAEARAHVMIARPLADVFAVLTDPTRTPRWSAPAVEEAWVTPPPHGLGSRRRAVTQAFGRRSENVAEVTAFVPDRSWTMTSVSGPRFVANARFEPVDGGTRVDVAYTFDFGRATPLVGAVVATLFERQLARDLARLKSMMESGDL
jgi:uncharacterized protein YndB with AHSA1/START domain